jgi:hypothetical protein
MKRAMEPENNPRTTAVIDEALHRVGSAAPAPGLEGRILTRLAAERMQMDTAPTRPAFFRRPALSRSLGLVSGCLLAFVVVAGSVMHSRRLHANQPVAPPALVLPGHGIGAASAVHPAAPASAPVPAGQAAHGRSTRRDGRARISPQSRKPPGVTPAPPAQSSSPDSQN